MQGSRSTQWRELLNELGDMYVRWYEKDVNCDFFFFFIPYRLYGHVNQFLKLFFIPNIKNCFSHYFFTLTLRELDICQNFYRKQYHIWENSFNRVQVSGKTQQCHLFHYIYGLQPVSSPIFFSISQCLFFFLVVSHNFLWPFPNVCCPQ